MCRWSAIWWLIQPRATVDERLVLVGCERLERLWGGSTVKAHLAALMRKLGARNRVEIAMWAYETGRMHGYTRARFEDLPPEGEVHGRNRVRTPVPRVHAGAPDLRVAARYQELAR